MKLRSLLFVPADSERKLMKSLDSTADVLILDLEDSVAEARKSVARQMAAEFIAAHAGKIGPALFVRVNPLDTVWVMADLAGCDSTGVEWHPATQDTQRRLHSSPGIWPGCTGSAQWRHGRHRGSSAGCHRNT